MAKNKNKNKNKENLSKSKMDKVTYLCRKIIEYQIVSIPANELRTAYLLPQNSKYKLCDKGFFTGFFNNPLTNQMFYKLLCKTHLNSIVNKEMSQTTIALHELPRAQSNSDSIFSGLHYNVLTFLNKVILSVPLYKSNNPVYVILIHFEGKGKYIAIPIHKLVLGTILENRNLNYKKCGDISTKFTVLLMLIFSIVFSGFIVRYLRFANQDFQDRYKMSLREYKIAQEKIKEQAKEILLESGFGFF